MFYGADRSQEEIIYEGSFYKVEPRRMASYGQTAYELICSPTDGMPLKRMSIIGGQMEMTLCLGKGELKIQAYQIIPTIDLITWKLVNIVTVSFFL